ncbi:AFG1-like ATPase [Xylaria bambusicola]|uniref:AFG1-like ATPase n=1 Tax=Xylaria bambusicola TaxID=326684 RepID=UPI00200859C6|nr:AFG1-like ATPase [Xylaria bambusicola]KAI0505979.1 AFG1-like ATPase [Xylaria bambusicola]
MPVAHNMRRQISSVTITDPLVKYQSLLAAGSCCPDQAQHRLAVHLQKVYYRLKDYSPSSEYRTRLRTITDALKESKGDDKSKLLAAESHPIRRNPLLARFFARTSGRDTLALTRVLTSHEEAIHIDSPQGLFLSGEVGTGKSMLLDLLAEGLPTSRKRRWHFNTFMLYTLSQLEHHRKMHSKLGHEDQQYSLLWMAKEMIEKSPILFLDEFQLPDKAASKILSNLFTAFFQLGGVLIASSNRMPEELEKAAGYEYTPPTASGLIGRALGLGKACGKGDLFGSSSDFASFLEVLKARCELWQMEGAKDWRRRDSNISPSDVDKNLTQSSLSLAQTVTQLDPQLSEKAEEPSIAGTRPKEYYLLSPDQDSSWNEAVNRCRLTSAADDTSWEATTITVYGRTVTIPRECNGVVHWDFEDLVSSFGPADYITMASTYHTFIIDNIPALVLLKKNEARRLITLLDALYEARCKLIVRAAVGPDELFFPDAEHTTMSTSRAITSLTPELQREQVDADAIHSETIAEAYQDQMSPFRPNISSYTDSNNTDYDPDQDSDFGVDPKKSKIDFSNTGAFTGEDERFAYKRAASRLWELCGERWHSRKGAWWQPLPIEARHWEGGQAAKPRPWPLNGSASGDVRMGPSIELDEPAGLQRLRVEYLKKTEAHDN